MQCFGSSCAILKTARSLCRISISGLLAKKNLSDPLKNEVSATSSAICSDWFQLELTSPQFGWDIVRMVCLCAYKFESWGNWESHKSD